MVTRLKQPLRLAGSLSVLDPEQPLTLSDTLQNSLAMPIADMSAAAQTPAARCKLVHRVSRPSKNGGVIVGQNIERIEIPFPDPGVIKTATFAQTVSIVTAWYENVMGEAILF